MVVVLNGRGITDGFGSSRMLAAIRLRTRLAGPWQAASHGSGAVVCVLQTEEQAMVLLQNTRYMDISGLSLSGNVKTPKAR